MRNRETPPLSIAFILLLLVAVILWLADHKEYDVNPQNNTTYIAEYGSTYSVTKDGCTEKNEIKPSFALLKPQAVHMYINNDLAWVYLFSGAYSQFCGVEQEFATIFGILPSVTFRVHPSFHMAESTTP